LRAAAPARLPEGMRILVLGGTAWLGGEIVREALRRGHEVTALARGDAGVVPHGAAFVRADRDELGAYDEVAGVAWDAVVDVARQPGHVRGALAALEALMNSDPGPQYGSPIVAEGDPWREIVETGKELDVDLIVIGSHRYHGRVDRALGTVAAKVVNHADRDVLVVHERGADRDIRGSG